MTKINTPTPWGVTLVRRPQENRKEAEVMERENETEIFSKANVNGYEREGKEEDDKMTASAGCCWR